MKDKIITERQPDTKVMDRLWLGSAIDARKRALDPDFIVVTVAWDSPVFGRFLFPMTDPGNEEDRGLLFDAADCVIELLENTHKQVLVHCVSGINRSTSVVMAVMAKKTGCTANNALERIKALRPFVRPFPNHVDSVNHYLWLEDEVER